VPSNFSATIENHVMVKGLLGLCFEKREYEVALKGLSDARASFLLGSSTMYEEGRCTTDNNGILRTIRRPN